MWVHWKWFSVERDCGRTIWCHWCLQCWADKDSSLEDRGAFKRNHLPFPVGGFSCSSQEHPRLKSCHGYHNGSQYAQSSMWWQGKSSSGWVSDATDSAPSLISLQGGEGWCELRIPKNSEFEGRPGLIACPPLWDFCDFLFYSYSSAAGQVCFPLCYYGQRMST